MGAIKIYPADEAMSKCVRERTNWTCEVCGRYHPEGMSRAGLHNSHWQGRGNWSTRFDPRNCFAQCWPCHREMGGDKHYFADWVAECVGTNVAFEIKALAAQPARGMKRALPLIAKHYRRQWRLMQAIRADGWQGRIEFQPYGVDGDPWVSQPWREAMREDA